MPDFCHRARWRRQGARLPNKKVQMDRGLTDAAATRIQIGIPRVLTPPSGAIPLSGLPRRGSLIW